MCVCVCDYCVVFVHNQFFWAFHIFERIFHRGGSIPNILQLKATTQIDFALSNDNAGLVNVAVYDIQGRKVATLHHDVIAAGNHSYTFDASNLSSGQYFVRITAPNFTQTKTMTLLK